MLRISNVKGSIKYITTPHTEKKIRSLSSTRDFSVNHKSNFTVIKVLHFSSNLVFSIWWHSNHVNVTGVRSETALRDSIKIFHQYTGLETHKNSLRIDNICANSKCQLDIPLPQLQRIAAQTNVFKTVLNRSYTPALYMKDKERGVCLIFRSGNLCFFGLNCFEKLSEFHRVICALMKER